MPDVTPHSRRLFARPTHSEASAPNEPAALAQGQSIAAAPQQDAPTAALPAPRTPHDSSVPVSRALASPIAARARQRNAVQKPHKSMARRLKDYERGAKLQADFITPDLQARTKACVKQMPVHAQKPMVDHIYALCRRYQDADAQHYVPMILESLWDIAPSLRLAVLALCEQWVSDAMQLPLRQRVLAYLCAYPPSHYAQLHACRQAFVLPQLCSETRVQILQHITCDISPEQIDAFRSLCMPVIEQLAPDAERIAELIVDLAGFNQRPLVPMEPESSDEDDEELHLDALFAYDEADPCCPLTGAPTPADQFEDDTPPALEDEHDPELRTPQEIRRQQRRMWRHPRRYNLENVMQAGRSQSARKAIQALQRQVYNPLSMQLTLKMIEAYLRNIDAQPRLQVGKLGSTRANATEVANALRVLTGENKNEDVVRRGPLGNMVTRFDNSKALIYNERWATKDLAPIGMGDLCALVWHAVVSWTNPLETPAQLAKTKELLRYSFVLNLAANIEDDGHQVCNTGICQRLVTTLQGYYGIKLDLVSAASLLNELARDFALKQGDAQAPPEAVAAFYESAIAQAEIYFHDDAQSLEYFQLHLQEYLKQSEMYYESPLQPLADNTNAPSA